MNTFRGRKTRLCLSVGIALGVTAQTDVLAQQPAQGQQGLEEIVVTGSRIARRDFSAQSPIVTVDSATFTERTNIGMEAALNQLPQFTAAGTQASTSPAGTPFPQAGAAPGAATLNLRGLGTNRNLVLMDGKRVQPVNGLLVVDINTIPSAAIERVEVITGGAAAVYGADAIAGVTNFILRKDFEGVEFGMQTGMSEEGDGEESQLSVLLGANFADNRGNVMVGANYATREIIVGKDRGWVVEGWNDPGTLGGGIGSSNLSQMSVTAGNGPTAFPGGLLPPGRNYVIDQNGNLFDSQDPLNPARPYTGPLGGYPNAAGSAFKINPDGTLGWNDFEHRYLQLPLERYSLFGSGHIEITDNVEVFADLRFSENYTEATGFVTQLFNIWSPTVAYDPANDDPDSPTFGAGASDHPVPRAFADLLNSRPTPGGRWTYVGGMDYIPTFTTQTTSNVYQLIAGVRGDAMVGERDWNWEVYVSHGKTSVNAHQPEGFPFLPRVQNLFDANQYGENFDVSSLPGFVPIAVTGHCTSGLPLFNANGSVDNTPTVSQDCADWMVLRMNSITTLTQDIVEGTVTGPIAELWAGELQFAFGANYRQEDFAFDPDSGFNANQRFPDVIQNIILPVTVDGTTDVTEVFAEFAIPLVRDRKLVQSFEINPGVRWSDYNTVGSVDTYKVTADWEVNDRVRVRGGHQFANRAPNVTELFTPRGGSQLLAGNDACAYYTLETPTWGNRPENPNRFNMQTLCQHLMVRDGAPANFYLPGVAGPFPTTFGADAYSYNVFGATTFFPFTIGVTEGNPKLESESANTTTVGIVLRPADRLTLSLDWYEIKLKNAIGIPAYNTVYQQCLDAQYNKLIGDAPGSHTGAELAAGNPFCALIQREWVGGVPLTPGNFGASRRYSAQYLNQGGVDTEGFDLQVDWGIGNFTVNLVASYLDHISVAPFPGGDFIDYTGTTSNGITGNSAFDFRTFSTVGYSTGRFSVGFRWQHQPELDTAPGTTFLGVDAHDQFDVFGTWRPTDRLTLRGGIDNLTNEDPEWVNATATNNNIGTTNSDYDQIGRRYFIGLTVEL